MTGATGHPGTHDKVDSATCILHTFCHGTLWTAAINQKGKVAVEFGLGTDALRPWTMDVRSSSTAAKKSKKSGGIVNFFRNRINQPKSANASASQSNSTQVSVSSAPSAHDLVSRNETGSAVPTASGKYIGVILVLSTTTQPPSMLPRIKVRLQCAESSHLREIDLGHVSKGTAAKPAVPRLLPYAI